MNPIKKTLELGQSIWYDDISKDALESGLLKKQLDDGVTGVTSNPAIFKKAIASGHNYDELIKKAHKDLTDEQVLEDLMVADVQAACDLFRPIYEASEGKDGFVSLEVSPRLCNDRLGQFEAGRRLFARIDRPNGMIKIPATPEGILAIEDLISEGINVNATLIFSPAAYRAVAEAFLKGLERWISKGNTDTPPQSVASVFVSRLDALMEKELLKSGLDGLINKLGMDNCRLIYQDFKRIFSGSRWERLMEIGCSAQRPLWASTSVKTTGLPATAYVDGLIGPQTVNTVPPATLEAFLNEGTAEVHIEDDVPGARERLSYLAATGLDIEEAQNTLLADGLEAFKVAYNELLVALHEARA